MSKKALRLEAQAFARSVGKTDAEIANREHSPDPDNRHGSGVKTRLADVPDVPVRRGWKVVDRKVNETRAPTARGRMSSMGIEHMTVESPEGERFSF